MSGFDFGSLRDPDAPQPGAHHRESVETRALELRRSASRKRMLVSGLALVVVIAAIAGIVATRPNPGPSIEVTDPSSTTAPSPSSVIGDRFVPPTTIENGLVVLPVTLPDGEQYTLRYPSAMRIAQLGFAATLGVRWRPEATECCRVVTVSRTTIAAVFGVTKPVAVYRGANGQRVPFFRAPLRTALLHPALSDHELVFQFGPWLVQVGDPKVSRAVDHRMSDQERTTWARSITGTIDGDGYLVLHSHAPISLGNRFIAQFGDVQFGEGATDFIQVGSSSTCGQAETDPRARHRNRVTVAWCIGRGVRLTAFGSPKFVDLAATKLQVTGPLTSSPSTTTSTTTPSRPPSHAVSASFVSADHGWVLEPNGSVAETTDGGATWKSVGSLAGHRANTKIRFADSLHGLAFSFEPNGGAPLWSTDDGGAHWNQLDTPFSHVFDLAMSRGRVYVVAMQQRDSNFRIWSSPSDQLTWTEDPLVIPIGAGPVPRIQLIFSGGGGWLVEVDRVVTAGARLDKHGRWLAWSPPCSAMNGPAEVAASSATDLVASCEEHVWGGGPIRSAAYFSHNGGVTFQRRPAPASGEVTSPNRGTAILAMSGGLQRTTDEGATWQLVAGGATYSALDLGFTTSTQGFVIYENGPMLMTYDAGATWSAVTLP